MLFGTPDRRLSVCKPIDIAIIGRVKGASQFDAGRHANVLDSHDYERSTFNDDQQVIQEIQQFLQNKRYSACDLSRLGRRRMNRCRG